MVSALWVCLINNLFTLVSYVLMDCMHPRTFFSRSVLFTLCATQLIVCLFATMVIHAMRIWNRNVIFEKFWESPSQRPFIKCIGLRNFTSCSSQEFFFLAIHQLAPHWLRTPSGQRPHANPELLSFDSHSGKSSFLSVFP